MAPPKGNKNLGKPAECFNDENWKGFVMMVESNLERDDLIKKTMDAVHSHPKPNFAFISRPSINDWIKESKMDLGKEAAATIASGQPLPDTIMAKVVKQRVLYMKQAQLDAKAASVKTAPSDESKKATKSTADVESVPEEPKKQPEESSIEGYNMYFCLLDIFSFELIDALKELSIQTDVIFRLYDYQPDSALIDKLESSNYSWKDSIAVKDLMTIHSISGIDLYDLLQRESISMAKTQTSFFKYQQSIKKITISEPENTNISNYPRFQSYLDSLPSGEFQSEFIVEAIMQEICPNDQQDFIRPFEKEQKSAALLELYDYFEKTIQKTSFYSQVEGNEKLFEIKKTIPYQNQILKQIFTMDKTKQETLLVELYNQMKISKVNRKIQSLFQKNKSNDSTKVIDKFQICHLSQLPLPIVDQSLILIAFEELVGKLDQKDYCWTESFDALTLNQIFLDLQTHFKPKFSIYKREKLVLIAFLSPPIDENTKVAKVQNKIKPQKPMNMINFVNHQNLDPNSLYQYNVGKDFKENFQVCYPQDGSIFKFDVQTKKLQIMKENITVTREADQKSWSLNAKYEDDQGSVWLNLKMSSSLHAKATLNTYLGISFEFLENNHLKLIPNSSKIFQTSQDLYRIITPQGHVIRYLPDKSVYIYYTYGNMSFYEPGKGWILTDKEGKRTSIDLKNVHNQLSPLKVGQEYYPIEKKKIITREDLVISTEEEIIGKTTIQFPDGTKITTSKKNDQQIEVLIENDRYPRVLVQPGKRTLIQLQNNVEIHYNSDSSFQVNVIASAYFKVKTDKKLLVSTSKYSDQVNTYEINPEDGTASITDTTGTNYCLSADGNINVTFSQQQEASQIPVIPKIEVLSQILDTKKSHQVPRSVAPRLFAVKEDGSGFELLRESYLLPYFERKSFDVQNEIVDGMLEEESSIYCISFKTNLEDKLKNLYIERELLRHPVITQEQYDQVKSALAKVERTKEIPVIDDTLVKETVQLLDIIQQHQVQVYEEEEMEPNIENFKALPSDFSIYAQETPGRPRKSRPVSSLKTTKLAETELKKRTKKPKVKFSIKRPDYGYFDSEEGKAFLAQPKFYQKKTRDTKESNRLEFFDPPPFVPTETTIKAQQPITQLSTQKPKLNELKEMKKEEPNIRYFKKKTRIQELDHLGRPRKEPLPPIPTLQTAQPGIQPNAEYRKLEDEIGKKMKTVSTATHLQKSSFIIHPDHLVFWPLLPGEKVNGSIMMTNKGIEPLRFKLKMPSYIQVGHKTGPVAPGMQVKLEVEAQMPEKKGEEKEIHSEIVVISEWDLLHIPVTMQHKEEGN